MDMYGVGHSLSRMSMYYFITWLDIWISLQKKRVKQNEKFNLKKKLF